MQHAKTDILIVGAGLAGASTAYHLARTSDREVLIIDKEATPGEHSSGRNASYIREYMEEPALQALATEGAAVLRRGTLAEYRRCGALLMGLGEEDAGKYCRVARGRGRWCPDDGTADVAGLLQSYLTGRRVQCSTELLDWRREGDGLSVQTSQGPITCRLLVNAAGPWGGQVGNLPLTPMGRHLFATPPLDWADPNWPFVWDVKGGLYFRPESGGLLLSVCDEWAAAPGDYSTDPAVAELLAERVMRLQPGLSEITIQRSWVGQRTFAEDRKFVIGFDPRERRLFHVAGLGGHGVTTSYPVGKLAASLILGRSDPLAASFDPARLLRPHTHPQPTPASEFVV